MDVEVVVDPRLDLLGRDLKSPILRIGYWSCCV